MYRLTLLPCLAALLIGVASAQEPVAIGSLRVGMAVEAAVSSLPDADWERHYYQPSGLMAGATAKQAVVFAGASWDVTVGTLTPNNLSYHRNIKLRREMQRASSKVCSDALSAAVVAIEQMVGSLLATTDGAAEGRYWLWNRNAGAGSVQDMGGMSKARTRTVSSGTHSYSWRPLSEPGDASIFVTAEYATSLKNCRIEIELASTPAPDEAQLRPIPLPNEWTLAAIEASRLNLARWLDEAALKRQPVRGLDGSFERALPATDGYFALLDNELGIGGILKGAWISPTGTPNGIFEGEHVNEYSVCGVVVPVPTPKLGSLAFLGPEWRPEFEHLDQEIGLPVSERSQHANAQVRVLERGASTFAIPPKIVYPPAASRAGEQDLVEHLCYVRTDQSLQCVPTKFKFHRLAAASVAALNAPAVRLNEMLPDGTPSAGACVKMDIAFQLPR